MPDTPEVPAATHNESSFHQMYEHVIAKVHSLKQDAARELEALESAGSRITFLRTHIGNLDTRLITLAREVKEEGLHFSQWASVPTMPDVAKAMLVANVPAPEIAAEPAALSLAVAARAAGPSSY